MRAPRFAPQSSLVAKAVAICAARVRLPAAAMPIRSRRLRRALATTSSGRSANASSRTNAVALARSPPPMARRLDQTVALEEALGHFLRRLLVDVDAGVELRHRFIVELRGDRVERVRDPGILVEHFLAYDRREVVRRRVMPVVLQHDEVECGNAAVGGKDHGGIDLAFLERRVGEAGVHSLDVVALELESVGGLPA